MTYLLDTHVLIWALINPEKLSETAIRLLQSPSQQIVVSTLSFWEISIKSGLGKIHLNGVRPEDFPEVCRQSGFQVLPLDADECASYHFLKPTYHKDPFDRMLIWLAISRHYPIISNDDAIKQYQSEGLTVIW